MRNPILSQPSPLVYLITDRQALPRRNKGAGASGLIPFVQEAARSGVDLIQIRERDLSGRDLFHLVRSIREVTEPFASRILVNDRSDIAACTGSGVHLTTRSIPAEVVRKSFGPEILVGASTHSPGEAEDAERGGADFVVFGPVFDTPSKRAFGSPVGLKALEKVALQVSIPVIAIGGVSLANCGDILSAGAAGLAAISLFAESSDIRRVVETIKSKPRSGFRDPLDSSPRP